MSEPVRRYERHEMYYDFEYHNFKGDYKTPDLLVDAKDYAALEAQVEALEQLQRKNEGRVKEMVDEHLLRERDALQAKLTKAEGDLCNLQTWEKYMRQRAEDAEAALQEARALLERVFTVDSEQLMGDLFNEIWAFLDPTPSTKMHKG